MVPSAFVALDGLPLTPTARSTAGRCPPTRAAPERGDGSCAPRSSTEELRRRHLGARCSAVERVGVHDNFFDLGGHSLLATRVAGADRTRRSGRAAGCTSSRRPTVAGIAAMSACWALRTGRHVDRRALDGACRPVMPRCRAGTATPSRCRSRQQRLWFLDQLDPGSPAYNIPSPLRLARPRSTCAALERGARRRSSARHEALRTDVRDCATGAPCQVIAAPLHGPLPRARPRGARRAPSGSAELGDWPTRRRDGRSTSAPAPLVRATLLRLAPRRARAAPGRCTTSSPTAGRWACCSRAGRALYAAASASAAVALPELPRPVRRLRASGSASGSRASVLDRAARLLAPSSSRGALARARAARPTARGPPCPTLPRGARTVDLPAARARRRALRRLRASGEGATLFMTLLAAFQALLAPLHRAGRHRRRLARSPAARAPSSRA